MQASETKIAAVQGKESSIQCLARLQLALVDGNPSVKCTGTSSQNV